jgi:hypothetical protein
MRYVWSERGPTPRSRNTSPASRSGRLMVAGGSWSVKKLVLVALGEDRTSGGVEPLGWEWGARKESWDQV